MVVEINNNIYYCTVSVGQEFTSSLTVVLAQQLSLGCKAEMLVRTKGIFFQGDLLTWLTSWS